MRGNDYDECSDWLAPVGLVVAVVALIGFLPLVIAIQAGLALGFGVGLAVFFVEVSGLLLVTFAVLKHHSLQVRK